MFNYDDVKFQEADDLLHHVLWTPLQLGPPVPRNTRFFVCAQLFLHNNLNTPLLEWLSGDVIAITNSERIIDKAGVFAWMSYSPTP